MCHFRDVIDGGFVFQQPCQVFYYSFLFSYSDFQNFSMSTLLVGRWWWFGSPVVHQKFWLFVYKVVVLLVLFLSPLISGESIVVWVFWVRWISFAYRQFGILFSSSSYFFSFLVKVLDRSFVISVWGSFICWFILNVHLLFSHWRFLMIHSFSTRAVLIVVIAAA